MLNTEKTKKTHRAMVLVEMITLIAVFAMLLVPISRLTSTLVKDIPAGYRLYQNNHVLLETLEAIKKDTAGSVDIQLDKDLLKLTSKQRVITYSFKNNTLIRTDNGVKTARQLRDGRIEFALHETGKNRLALEVNAYITFLKQGRQMKKLYNSCLFFTGMLTEKEVIR